MAHQVAIAKASLAAGLLRPDPTSVSRDEISALHSYLDRALSHCSPANIQTCKSWLLGYVVASANRVSLLAKYLIALAADTNSGTGAKGEAPGRPSVKRKRLHMLYLLNDLFHHAKYHTSSSAAFSTLSGTLQSHFAELLSYAASYDRDKHPKHHRRLNELLDIWHEHGYFGAEYMGKLREVVANAAVSGPVTKPATPGVEAEPDRKPRAEPFVMPATHGDPSTPYYDLPAGNLIPHIIPNSTIPLRPDMIKPLQFLAGPADEKLVTALKVFLADVDRMYEPGEVGSKDGIVDVDELGQTVVRDEITGDILEGDTYYGWSRSFCQQMKKRNAHGQSQSRSRSRSQTPKRRRYSSASDDSRYRSRSRTPRRDRRYSRSRSRSRSRSYSPAPAQPQAPAQQNPHGHPHSYPPPPPPMPFPGGNASTPAFPPPPPPNFHGAWPPPPPPLPSYPNYPQYPQMQMQGPPPQFPPGSYNYPPGGRGWHQHPPPPPPAGRGWR
ncbi:hypothetical protein BDV18DRAFT_161296 [Aspergillus unguis]